MSVTRLSTAPSLRQRERKRLVASVAVVCLAHALALFGLSYAALPKAGVPHTSPVLVRWVEARVNDAQGAAAHAPSAPAIRPDSTPARTLTEAPKPTSKPADRPVPHTPSRAADDSPQPMAKSDSPSDASAQPDAPSLPPLPEGQDPLRMLPTTPERFELLSRLSATAYAEPDQFAQGSAISLQMPNGTAFKTYRFVVVGEETVASLKGLQVPALHLASVPMDSTEEKIDVWLAPQLVYRPIQMSITNVRGEVQYFTARSVLDQFSIDPSAAPASAAR